MNFVRIWQTNNTFSTRAYDYSGRAIDGGLPTSEGRGSFSLIFLRFGAKEVIQCSCNGATVHTNQGNFFFLPEKILFCTRSVTHLPSLPMNIHIPGRAILLQ